MAELKKYPSRPTRREFLASAVTAMAFTYVPSHVLGQNGRAAASERPNIAGVGVGGKGFGDLESIEPYANIVALCDVDDRMAGKAFGRWPAAGRYKDYRVMLDKQPEIDAVIVATPDHTHAVISLEAMRRGKHVYTQKPLTHTVHEAQVLTQAAREHGVATQMGNQGQAGEHTRRLREMIWDGVIGSIHEVHVWTDRPNKGLLGEYWPQGIARPTQTPGVPSWLDWDLFIGPAPVRPYHPAYHPFKWRGWWDFGTGALGDIGCHALDPVFRALKLKYPISVQAVSTRISNETYPSGSIVTYEFPAREEIPPVTLKWYDGGLRPERPAELAKGLRLGTNGTLYVGEKGKLLGNTILPESLRREYESPEPHLERSPGHYEEWIEAIKGGKPAGSSFDWAGPLTETVLLGNIALRMDLREKLDRQILTWDAEQRRFSNLPEANAYLHKNYREGWSL